MKVKITRSSDYKFTEFKDFDTLEQAIDYALSLTDITREIIVDKDSYNAMTDKQEPLEDCDYRLEIYDDYRE